MRLYGLLATLAALVVCVPWATQNLYLRGGPCELLAWLWLAWGAGLGRVAQYLVYNPSVGLINPPVHLSAIGAVTSCAAFLLPPTVESVPALGALYWAAGGVFAAARSEVLAANARQAWRTGAAWSLAADSP
jgi:hypothetical protein